MFEKEKRVQKRNSDKFNGKTDGLGKRQQRSNDENELAKEN